MSGCGLEVLPDVREWSLYPPECLEGPSGCAGVVGWPSWMSGSGPDTIPDVRKDLPDVQKDLPDFREWQGVPPECLGVAGCPPGCPIVVVRYSRMTRCGREALPDARE